MRIVAGACLALVLMTLGGCRYYRLNLRKERLARADVIIVPGQELTEDGKGSFVLWNRVLMGKLMFERGYAPRLIVSGGKPKAGVTEATKMLEFAERLGVPTCAVLLEPSARTSVENARFSVEIMVRHGYRSALVVTDPFHILYAMPVFKDAFRDRGLKLHWTPVDYDLIRGTGLSRPPDAAPD